MGGENRYATGDDALVPRRTAIAKITVIAPMLNEGEHVESFVADLAAQDYSGDLELIVADGGSTDGSAQKLESASERHGVELILLENEAGWVSHGLNACIEEASGELIARLDCHSRYPANYLRLCAAAAVETGAWCVGGVIDARGQTPTERAVACAMDTPFGGIGFYRVFSSGSGPLKRLTGALGMPSGRNGSSGERMETDTLTFGAFLPEVFERVGRFDESLRRNQDDELNLRIRRAGGSVVLDPAVRVEYRPRGSLRAVFRQYYDYGFWKVAVMRKHRQPPNPRALAPVLFVSSLAGLATLAALSQPYARRALVAEVGLYAAAAAGFGAACVRRRGEDWALVPRVVSVFPAFHLGYGVGMIAGVARGIADRDAARAGRRERS